MNWTDRAKTGPPLRMFAGKSSWRGTESFMDLLVVRNTRLRRSNCAKISNWFSRLQKVSVSKVTLQKKRSFFLYIAVIQLIQENQRSFLYKI